MSKSKYSQKKEIKQNYDYFLILDFEATCDKPDQPSPMEIIEFPVIKLNAKTFENEDVFHSYVRPHHHPTLTTFCTNLTGIIQEMVDNQPKFDVVFANFQKWMEQTGLICPETKRSLSRFTFVTCGNWDLQIMLPDQCKLFDLRIPSYMKAWINVKKSYADATGKWPKSMEFMLEKLKIRHVGRLHSGIDDCKNLALIVNELVNQHNFVFKNTSCEF